MRNFSQDAGSEESSPTALRAEECRPGKKKRSLARVHVGPGTATLGGDKKDEEELFNSTVVVTSCLSPPDANELHTPTNIQLHEEVFVHHPCFAGNSPLSLTAEGHTPTQQRNGSFLFHSLSREDHHGPIQHEQDHDCCPFMAVRRSEWTLRIISKVRHTSPFDWPYLLSSFSIKNAFMFYPPPPTYGFFRDEDGAVQVRSQTGKRAPRLDHERIEYLRRKCRMSDKVPDDLVAGALHGIAIASQQDNADGGGSGDADSDSESSFKLIFIPWENDVQSYYIHSGSVVFGRRVHMGHRLFTLAWPSPIPCSIIRPRRRMSSHVAIFFHCNGEDIGRPSCLRLLTLANALHMTILVPEYPGYGLFEGQPSEAAINGSMERVIEFLFSSDPCLTPSRLILVGHSIGTGVAIHAAKFIKKVFLKLHDSPDLSHRIPYACPMSRGQQNSAGYAAAVRCPQNALPVPSSAVPVTSPTAPIPTSTPHGASPRPPFSPPNVPLPSNRVPPDSSDSGKHAAAPQQADTADTGADRRRARTSLHAPYGELDDARRRSGPKATPPFLCPHYALGGVILLAPFASLRCVEKWTTLRSHGFDVQELERRRLSVPEDVLVPAPEEWAEDAHALRDTGADPPNMDFLRPSPLLFDVARYISFNRFPTIDVVRELQDEVSFFTHTPLLLLHGAQDVLIPAINSVAIATKLRQATDGRAAKVYMGLLHNEGHNNLHCSHIIRRFYKDVILLPHLRAQRQLREELEETLGDGLGRGSANSNVDKPAAVGPIDSASSSNKSSPPPPPRSPPSASSTTVDADGEGSCGEPHAFEAPLLHFPIVGTNRNTEPFDEERPVRSASKSTTQQPGTGATATADAAASAAVPPAPAARPPNEPYLYFIEPAFTAEGGTWLANGIFAGPVRIRLLHPPQQRNSTTTEVGVVPEEGEAHPHASPAASILMMQAADPRRAHSRHHQHDHLHQHQYRDLYDPAVEAQPSSPRTQRTRHSSRLLSCGMQAYHASEEFEESLRDTLLRTQPPSVNFAPAATMLHIALFHHLEHYDVGSIAVASVTKHSVDATVALAQWRSYRRNHFIFRCCTALYYFATGSFFISLAICHGVLTRPSKLRPYVPAEAPTKPYHLDARVVIWGVLDGFAYLLLGVVRFFNTRLGLGNLSKYMDTPSSMLAAYATCRIMAYILCGAVGILMAMIIALTPPDRGGVDWDRWSDLPYGRRVWIADLPRWTMVTSASVHIIFTIAIFAKNH
ncbi:hypothetical protein ABB37_05314 [Leptomonas pyrrhocoris]|uniref:AB hydrolase-1 domain-containing protein n=1 Tax=Leptomonas pyrrhocoris TaxID=157538 RepID=A0A0N0VF17_LEPPY|nr:hypothetical protein ABB37_05314 [Leptomonas pyrrhocoris]KPA79482.1 hypothetical protein ABB37_05314 [Leptomonas pyrrhocoris]|eukprot:XP_015657921.1 hypothetical protein ABB37_05314 [Leptomonas pyrrhocoris]